MEAPGEDRDRAAIGVVGRIGDELIVRGQRPAGPQADRIEGLEDSLEPVAQPSVTDEERSGQLAVIKLAEKEWVRPVGVIYRSDRTLSLAAKKFVQLLETAEKL